MGKITRYFASPPVAPAVTALLLVLFLATGTVPAGDNAWTSVGPFGGSVTAVARIATGPDVVYAGTWGGVWFKTQAAGLQSWTAANSGLTYTTVTSLVRVGDYLFAGTVGGGVYRGLITGGIGAPTAITWTPINTGLTNFNITGLATDSGGALYAATELAGVFQCSAPIVTGTWTPFADGLTGNSLFVRSIYVDTTPTGPDVVYIGTDAGGIYYRAVSGSANWSVVGGTTAPFTNTSVNSVNSVLAYTNTAATPITYLVAATDAGGVYSFDGASWAEVKFGANPPLSSTIGADISSLVLYVDNTTPATVGLSNIYIIAGTDKKGIWLFNPTDGWHNLSGTPTPGPVSDTHVRALWIGLGTTDSNGIVFANAATLPGTTLLSAGTWSGLYQSINTGTAWTDISGGGTTSLNPMNATRAYSVAYLQTNPAITGTIFTGTHGSGVFKQTPAATSWTRAYLSSSPLDMDIFTVAADPRTGKIYAGSGNEGVFMSPDKGSTWYTNGLAGKDVRKLVIDPSNSSFIYAGTWQGIYKTTNGGSTWNLSGSAVANNIINALVINPVNVSILYAGTNGGVYKTTDGGTTWAAANTGLTNTYVMALAIDPQNPSILYAGTMGGGAFKTTNAGASWTAINYNLDSDNIYALVLDPLKTSVVYAGCNLGTIYKTMDGGTNWTLFAPDLSATSPLNLNIKSEIRDMNIIRQVDKLTLYVGTNGNGVWEIRLPALLDNRPTEIISTDSSSILGNGMSYNGRISVASGNDGRYVAFQSAAGNLVTSDTNGFLDIFVKDRVTNKTVRISQAADGTQANGDSYTPSISQDGRYVAFASQATNLVPGDTNGVADIFVYDRDADANGTYDEISGVAIVRVSINSNGNQADNYSLTPVISDNGRFVAFTSFANNLVATNLAEISTFRTAAAGGSQIFVHDRLGTNTIGKYDMVGNYLTRLISNTAVAGTPGNASSTFPSISGDGAFIAYQSRATNLNGAAGTGTLNIVAAKILDPTLTTVALYTPPFSNYYLAGTAATVVDFGDDSGFNFSPVSISSRNTGLYSAAFHSQFDNAAAASGGEVYYSVITDGAPPTVTTYFLPLTAGAGASGSYGVSISGDATRVAFTSDDVSLVTGDTNGKMDLFVYTFGATPAITRHSLASDGSQGNGQSELPALTGNGYFMAFHSWANNLVPGDSNNTVDVFVARIVTTTTVAPTSTTTTSSTLPHPAGRGIRSLTGCYVAGYATPVSLTVTPGETAVVYTVEETVPPGWTVLATDIGDNGIFDASMGKVRWGPFYDNNARTFTYKVTATPSSTGVQIFSGILTFEGYNNGTVKIVTGGDTTVYDNCQMHPADTNKDMRIEAGEVTAYSFAWITGQVWSVPPNPIPLNYVARAGYLWRNGEIYRYRSTSTAPDCWYPLTISTTANQNSRFIEVAAAREKGSAVAYAPERFQADVPVQMSITITPPVDSTTYAAEEVIPAGWQILSISEGGRWDARNGRVKWGPFFDQKQRTLSYRAVPDSTITGQDFAGRVNFDGTLTVPFEGTRRLVRNLDR